MINKIKLPLALLVVWCFVPENISYGQSKSDFTTGIEALEALRTIAIECNYRDVTPKELHVTSALLYVYRNVLRQNFNYTDKQINLLFEEGHRDGLNVRCGSVTFQQAMYKYHQMLEGARSQAESFEILANSPNTEPYK